MFDFKYVVKDAQGRVALETIFEDNALARASLPGYKLLKVPMSR